MPCSKMKPPTVTEDFLPEIFIIPDTIVDAHPQTSEHDADQASTQLAMINPTIHLYLPSGAGPGGIIKVMTRKPRGGVGDLGDRCITLD